MLFYSTFLRPGHFFIKTGKDRLDEGVPDELTDDLPSAHVRFIQRARDVDPCGNLPIRSPFEELGGPADQHLVHFVRKTFLPVHALVVNLQIFEERNDVLSAFRFRLLKLRGFFGSSSI